MDHENRLKILLAILAVSLTMLCVQIANRMMAPTPKPVPKPVPEETPPETPKIFGKYPPEFRVR